jgi:hypothetical protein
MENLHFEHVIQKVWKDGRTDWDRNVSLGYPFDVIRDEVINRVQLIPQHGFQAARVNG